MANDPGALPRGKILAVLEAATVSIDFQCGIITAIDADAFPTVTDEIIRALMIDQQPKTNIERLTADFKELEKKMQALSLYMKTGTFYELERMQRVYMEQQSRAMHAYLSALRMRLDLYGVTV